ncbi:hypothetical protein CRE_13553 [Caenorhabditis remanei]|uniref:G-protein coupled receptors family 1 profile domain-containing protein n=1 Tax=Caenorhabditis remanei TaxID=31234 RepID=E3MR95_CAERE|nr:hypothetical protein CRE_13553 [Caenorhabditis remanei]
MAAFYDEDNFYQNFNNSYFGDVNFYISGVISLVFNVILIYVVSKVKGYKAQVKLSMNLMALLRILFSLSIALTCPSILYSRRASSLYIMKNGINFPNAIGHTFLALFVSFMVMSCNGPAIQYIQVSNMLSFSYGKVHRHISIIPVFVAITSLALIFFGYVPPFYTIRISSLVRRILEQEGDTPYLIITVRLTYDETNTSNTFQLLSQTCTLFILITMFFSIITVILCTVYIQKQMKIRFIASSNSKKSQEQLNKALLLQFILPFITIHIPFYIVVVLPFFGIAWRNFADRIFFLFCWCPAINPILVILLVKKIRKELFTCENGKKSQAQTRSIALVISL